ncbi:MAG TPA: class I tRNA ligase family protein, partial [Usitatibacteraceae bacterium]|nr:class I tRNA ligase family protein [Usitatibacteraceae bacterium]
AMQAIQNFCSEELGGFYLDILKDRLYTTAANSGPRRAAQSALREILLVLNKLIAPVLSFTAEEIWAVMHPASDDSVFLHRFHDLPELPGEAELLQRWSRLRAIRAGVMKDIEAQREAGKVGSSLQAEVRISAGPQDADLLRSLGDDLRYVLITSQAGVDTAADGASVQCTVVPSPHAKCERCWHYRADTGADPSHPTLCARCFSNLFGAGEQRFYA